MSVGRRVPWASSPKVFIFAIAVGVIGGLVGTTFQVCRTALQRLFMGKGGLIDAALALEWWQRLLLPFGGAIAASILAYGLTRKRESQGMADVMEAVTLKKATKLSVRGTIARALSSLALISTGGSVGREGPIVYLSAALGTRFSRLLKVPTPRLGLFSGCGVAAGLASAYYAPFGAALFAMEIVLGNFAVQILGPVIVASVVSALVATGFSEGLFAGWMKTVPMYDLESFSKPEAIEYLIFPVLGLTAAATFYVFNKTMHSTEGFFKRLPISAQLRLPLGGLLLGIISIFVPHVWGGGHDMVSFMLADSPELSSPFQGFSIVEFVLILLLMKILATSITIGAGGSGGLFTPNIAIGTCVGLLIGYGAQAFAPDLVDDPRTYGVVGMAAGLAAATQAPIMSSFFLFEMTKEGNLVMPLILASMAASVGARALGLESMYVLPLKRRGLQIPEGIEETTLTTTRVRDIMREEAVWIRDTATYDMIVGMVMKTRRDFVYVVDNNLHFVGVVRLHDIKNFLADDELGTAVIAADLTVQVPSVTPENTLAEVLDFFDDAERHELAVVDEDRALLGVVDRRDLLTALSVEVLQSQQLRAKFVEHKGAQHYVEIPGGHAVSRIPVPKEMAGLTLADCDFRQKTGLTILTIIHTRVGKETRIQPEAGTILHEQDSLIVMGALDAIKELGGQV